MYCGNSMSTMIKCSNCGADFIPNGDRCPYCGYIYEIGAQQEYMSHLNDIREALDVVDEEAADVYKKTLGGAGKHIVAVVLILLTFTGVFFAGKTAINYLSAHGYIGSTADKGIEEIKWQNENFPKFDKLYEEGNYDELVNELILNEENWEHSRYNWEHYDFISIYSNYLSIRDIYIPLIENGEIIDYMDGLVYDSFYLYYSEWSDPNWYGNELTEEEKEFLADKRQYAVDKIIYEYMHFTDEDMQRFLDEGDVYEDSNVLKYEECKKIAKKYKKNFG